MRYVQLGNTGLQVSRLGFGSMRLPLMDLNGKEYVDVESAIATIHRALELGVNYVDSAYDYCNEEAELVVGTALDQWPGKKDIILTSKCNRMRLAKPGDLRRQLEHQLWRLRRDHLDFYLFHAINWKAWHEVDSRTNWIKDMIQAKEEGLTRHIGFSFHDKPDKLISLVDQGFFDLVLCQYNYLDRANEEAINYANEKGLGVVVMGPVGAGRLAVMPYGVRDLDCLSSKAAPELAFRYVFSHPSVHVALSGMSSIEMVEQNVATVEKGPLSPEEVGAINAIMVTKKELADSFCPKCNACYPCQPKSLNVPRLFELYNYYKVYGLEPYALEHYGRDVARGRDAAACDECGACLERCPEHFDIPAKLKEVAEAFGKVL